MRQVNCILLAGGLAGVLMAFSLPTSVQAQQSGVEIWSQTCGNCHLIQPANRYTADQWESIMVRMRTWARLTDDESDAVLEFLKGGAKRLASAETVYPVGLLLASADARGLAWTATVSDSTQDFASLCVACHGKTGQGDGPVATALNPRPTDLSDPEFQRGRTDDELEVAVTKGKDTMPGFENQLTPEQIRGVVAYMRSLLRN